MEVHSSKKARNEREVNVLGKCSEKEEQDNQRSKQIKAIGALDGIDLTREDLHCNRDQGRIARREVIGFHFFLGMDGPITFSFRNGFAVDVVASIVATEMHLLIENTLIGIEEDHSKNEDIQ